MLRALLTTLAMALVLPLSAASFRSHDGVTLHYDVVGKGEPVLLLSGGPGFSPEYLRPIAEKLRGKRSFILLHQRGTGLSQLPKVDMEALALPKLIADVDAMRKELGLEKITIAGHSFGGILAMMYAREHPRRVAALALIDSGGPTLQSVAAFTKNLESRFTEGDRALIAGWSAPAKLEENRRKAILEIARAKTPAYFSDRKKAAPLMESMDETSFSDGAFWSIVPQMMHLDLREGLEKVGAPVLVIHGKDDPLPSGEEVHSTFPGSTFVLLENAGHFPWLEQPDAFYAALGDFLAAE